MKAIGPLYLDAPTTSRMIHVGIAFLDGLAILDIPDVETMIVVKARYLKQTIDKIQLRKSNSTYHGFIFIQANGDGVRKGHVLLLRVGHLTKQQKGTFPHRKTACRLHTQSR
jgi:hypothetical protein